MATYRPWFSVRNKIDFSKNRIPLESACHEEQLAHEWGIMSVERNRAKMDTIRKGTSRLTEWHKFQLRRTLQFGIMSAETIDRNRGLYIAHGFQPETETMDLGKKGYYRKGYVKRSRVAQILALQCGVMTVERTYP